jgi:hypothetical protein
MGVNYGKTHLFSGHAQLPKGIPMQAHLQRTTALLEVDVDNDIIVRASFMTVHPHTADFLSSIAEGYNLSKGIEPLLREMEERAHVSSINAFTKAIEIAYQKFLDYKKKRIHSF